MIRENTVDHITITIPRGMILTDNNRHHYYAKARGTADLRLMGYRAWIDAGRPKHHRVKVLVSIDYPDRRKREASNLNLTIKALVDGMVSGVYKPTSGGYMLPDDDDTHLIGPWPLASGSLSPKRGGQGTYTFHFQIEEIPA